jgi:16S rRNA (guanine527-N7)-methyltransferase
VVEGLGPEAEERLRRWMAELLSTPGLTALHDPRAAWRQHVEDSLAALPVVRRFAGPVIDVGSGGGAPGLPLAAVLTDRSVTLLEASRRKCDFLGRVAQEFANVEVVQGRAEEQAVDEWGVAVAKALAPPPVAAEWCLPLVRPGGAAVLYAAASAAVAETSAVSQRLGGAPVEVVPIDDRRSLLVLRKLEQTPPGFPRRPGMARKRPLA